MLGVTLVNKIIVGGNVVKSLIMKMKLLSQEILQEKLVHGRN